MTSEDLQRYTKFYKGQPIVPPEYEGKDEEALWAAECFVCEDLHNNIDEDNIRESLDEWVEAYLGKWTPWRADDLMTLYRSKR